MGEIVDGTYLIERLLGKGSMGEVYAARNLRTEGRFAIKVLLREAAFDQELYQRFRNEARVTSVLRHPGIVQVVDFSTLPDGRPYMVMEHLDGEDLHARLRRVGRLPLQQALRICRQVGSALHVAHRAGVVHRDLKPGNIVLVQQDQGDRLVDQAKVIDFGLSRIRGALAGQDQTLDSQILGTPQYMSPEAAQALNSKLDGRSDQFSLAVILYLMLSGRSPFLGRNFIDTLHRIVHQEPAPLRGLRPDLPAHVDAAIRRGLSKCKVERFPTIIDFCRAVEGLPPLPLLEDGGIRDTLIDLGGSVGAHGGAPAPTDGAQGDEAHAPAPREQGAAEDADAGASTGLSVQIEIADPAPAAAPRWHRVRETAVRALLVLCAGLLLG